jgi:hypothetical protein
MRTWSNTLEREVQRVDAKRLLSSEPSAWVEHFVSLYTQDAPKVHVDKITTAPPEEADVDVSNTSEYGRRMDGRPTTARGTRVTFHVPLDGDAALLLYCPSRSYRAQIRANIRLSFTRFGG